MRTTSHKKSGFAMTLRRIFCGWLTLTVMLISLKSWARTQVSSVSARQCTPWNGQVEIVATIQGVRCDVASAKWHFMAKNNTTKEVIAVEHITHLGGDVDKSGTWTQKFIWDAKADVGVVMVDDIALTVEAEIPLGGVQLWEKGPYWSECNVGATKPEESGYYFWWGDTIGYEYIDGSWSAADGSRNGYKFSAENCLTRGMPNSELKSCGYIDAKGHLVDVHDAATVHFGTPWRMPTINEFSALIENCTTTWTTRNGVNGRLVTGKGVYVSKSVFFPAGSYVEGTRIYDVGQGCNYWSSTPSSSAYNCALQLVSGSSYFRCDECGRLIGSTIRPLRGFTDLEGDVLSAATTHFTFCPLEVKSVAVRQHYPWNGLVDVFVTIQGICEDVSNAKCYFAATNTTARTAIHIEHIVRDGGDSGCDKTWMRKFVWDAKTDVGAVKVEDVSLVVDAKILGGVQLWDDGPYWAECNVGAMKPEECGYYFWWGDTVGYQFTGSGWNAVDGSRKDYSFTRQGCPTANKSDKQLQSAGYIDSFGNLVAAYDAATVHLGEPWRMPTDAEMSALISKCDTKWIECNGVCGRLVTGRGIYSANSIFFPAAGYGRSSDVSDFETYGYYWTSSSRSADLNSAWPLSFSSSQFNRGSDFRARGYGQNIRPLRSFAK